MSEDLHVDLAVIGAGPGGYVAALRAAQLGLKTVVIEKEFVGGTCLNIGCIPSKALLDATHLLTQIRNASAFGIRVEGIEVDYPAMRQHKAKVVKMLTGGVRSLLRKAGVTLIEGEGSFAGPGVLQVDRAVSAATSSESKGGAGGRVVVRAGSIIIASGSGEAQLPGVPLDGELVISSRGALDLEEVPQRMVVVGGGYIGLEMSSVYSRLGTDVVVLEMLDRLLPEMDQEVAETAEKLMREQGLDIRLNARVSGVTGRAGDAEVAFETTEGRQTVATDIVLVAIGRRPLTAGLGLDAIDLEPDPRGYITVDHGMRTGVPGVYAVGDVVPTPMLAHVAMDEGVVAAECAAGRDAAMEYRAIPAVVFTSPELASVGLKEEEALARGRKLRVGRFPFRGNARARARNDVEGWVKIIADAETDELLGAHCVGPEAGHLIHEAVVAMGYSGYSEDLALTVHAHPTLSEAFKEAALAVDGRSLHI